MSANLKIKEVCKDDLSVLLELVRELAVYEEMQDVLVATPEIYAQSLFEDKLAHALLLELEGEPIGYAIYFYTFSSFLGRGGLYLEDLYIREKHRKKGYAKAVFKHLAKICKDKNLQRLEWVCLNSNQLGIDFYEGLKAENLSHTWRTYRLDRENLLNLIDGSSFGEK